MPPALGKPHQQGFTLIELMIALVLGLIIIAAAITVYLSNRRAYMTTTALAQVQDSARVAYELLARDIRAAAGTACGGPSEINFTNTLKNNPTYADFDFAIQGYDNGVPDPDVAFGSASGQRVNATDSSSLKLIGTRGIGASFDAATGANLTLNQPTSLMQTGDIAVLCGPGHATVFQVTDVQNSGKLLVHAVGGGPPGNNTTALGFAYPQNSLVTSLSFADWYIGNNPQGGHSLYRLALVNQAGVPTLTSQEMVRGVVAMQLTYHTPSKNEYVKAASIANWDQVNAVHIVLTIQGAAKHTDTDQQPLERKVSGTVALRNRLVN